ncbi:hypothetical protein Rs2_15792 [Raphanus sativus]|nr:hypothetical protein Rs2_15792 [Raphanus sativus]
MTPELQGLIAALRRGDCLWSSLTLEQIRNAYAMSQGRNRDAPIALEEPICPQQDRKGKKVKRVEASVDPSNASLGAEPLKQARRTPERRVLRPRSQAPSPSFWPRRCRLLFRFMRTSRRLMSRLSRMLVVIESTLGLAELLVRV